MFYLTNLTEVFHNTLIELCCALHALLLHPTTKVMRSPTNWALPGVLNLVFYPRNYSPIRLAALSTIPALPDHLDDLL